MDEEIRIEAYRIYEWRTFFNPPFPGNDVTDWFEAKDNIEEERKIKLLNIPTSRIEKYF